MHSYDSYTYKDMYGNKTSHVCATCTLNVYSMYAVFYETYVVYLWTCTWGVSFRYTRVFVYLEFQVRYTDFV